MRLTEEEAQLILAAVYYMSDEQAECANFDLENEYKELFYKLVKMLDDITE